jgi:D-alanyl-D-alanine carboxypeptidase (penicillin-binding protein 5/6)
MSFERKAMKKGILIALMVLVLANLAYGRNVTQRRPHSSKQSSQTQSAVEKEAPYKAYIVTEATTGKVLAGDDIHLKRPPASITKLMLAAVVMEKVAKGALHLSDEITVSRQASKMGGSQVFLKEGETFTLEELMKATLVASANDAAYAIGEYAAGSKEKFVDWMNQKAKELDMKDTVFHSLHGLPPSKGDEEDLTSCGDLAILARDLLRYPKILEWTSIQNDRFRDGTFVLYNHNKLLGRMPEVDGLKTGYYREAGYNVVATGKRDGLRLIVVVMGSPTQKVRDRAAEEKFKKYFAEYRMFDVVREGEVIDKEISLPDGKTPRIKGIAAESFSYPLPRNQERTITKEANLPKEISGEVKKGQVLGEIIIRAENEAVGKVNIVSPVSVPEAGFVEKLLRIVGFGS